MMDFKSWGLLTDLYQLTMAYGYWSRGRAGRRAIFHLSFRQPPFGGGYVLAAGLGPALDLIEKYRFADDDLQYLATLTGNDGQPLFPADFLSYLGDLRISVDVDAVPEGSVVFPHEPLLRIERPILEGQLLESALLNLLNFQSLIATKASRIVAAAQGDSVLEFGLRRAQGVDGALAASRAAFIGGCKATSNVLAGRCFGIPVRGTHAHSWVMSYDSELEAFLDYAEAMPNNCVFLVDTYDTLVGVKHAIEVGIRLQERGHRMVGIRLDSGDLAWLSIQARQLLDAAGFHDAVITASNDLDERLIQSLKQQSATITVWGVGTKLVTAFEQPALGGVYKLGAIEDPLMDFGWRPVMKISEQPIKSSIPGKIQVRRFYGADGEVMADMIFNELQPPTRSCAMVDLQDTTRHLQFHPGQAYRDLLEPVMRDGCRCVADPGLPANQQFASRELARLYSGVRRFDNPHRFSVGLEASLHELRLQLTRTERESRRARRQRLPL